MRGVTLISLLQIILMSDFIEDSWIPVLNLFKEVVTSHAKESLENSSGHLLENEHEKANVLVLL